MIICDRNIENIKKGWEMKAGDADALKEWLRAQSTRVHKRTPLMHGLLWWVKHGETCKNISRIFLNQTALRTKEGKKKSQIPYNHVGFNHNRMDQCL